MRAIVEARGFHCIPACFAGGIFSSLKLHQFYVGQGPGDAEVVVMTGWMADELRPTRGWGHNWDHLGLGSEWSWA
ncbi:hypothetical protein J1605_008031 [Eschrichtius robustus]|uniref:Uncharacterized protein n=1 Tax=Eschrichtius robustus TaxID=9764 RepID=A0AB34H1W9_ESCRO|nr:hypothetical protein J1605_008031 [Eschrichtius robustus]